MIIYRTVAAVSSTVQVSPGRIHPLSSSGSGSDFIYTPDGRRDIGHLPDHLASSADVPMSEKGSIFIRPRRSMKK